MTRPKYTAQCHRERKWWVIHIREIDHTTQARRLDQVDYMARDLIALMRDIPEDSFDLRIETELPEKVQGEVDEARELSAESEIAQARASESTRRAARDLSAMGLTVRDVGATLGLSPQRVSQLLGRRKAGRAQRGAKVDA